MGNGAATLEDGVPFLTELNVIVQYDPAITLPGIYPQGSNTMSK